MEIAKKYLVTHIPNLEDWDKREIKYYYINFDPEIKVKKTNGEYFLIIDNIKLDEEIEISISIDEFEKLKNIAGGCYLVIDSHSTVLDGNSCRIDIYKNIDELATVEIKFNGIRESVRFPNPDWFGQDITTNSSYNNSSLATHQFLNA